MFSVAHVLKSAVARNDIISQLQSGLQKVVQKRQTDRQTDRPTDKQKSLLKLTHKKVMMLSSKIRGDLFLNYTNAT